MPSSSSSPLSIKAVSQFPANSVQPLAVTSLLNSVLEEYAIGQCDMSWFFLSFQVFTGLPLLLVICTCSTPVLHPDISWPEWHFLNLLINHLLKLSIYFLLYADFKFCPFLLLDHSSWHKHLICKSLVFLQFLQLCTKYRSTCCMANALVLLSLSLVNFDIPFFPLLPN